MCRHLGRRKREGPVVGGKRMKPSRCVFIYCTHLPGWCGEQWRETPGGGGGRREGEAAAINTHHANSPVIYGEFLPVQGTSDLHRQLSEEDVSGQGFHYRIPLRLRDTLLGSPCLSVLQVRLCVCVCVLLS